MSDLDTLRPEVADAVSALDETTCMTNPGLKWYATIRAELLRLATIEADALIALDCEHDWQVEHKRAEKAEAELAAALKANRDCVDHFEQMQAELAALKARMFQGIVLGVDDLARGHAGLPSEWRGKRVLLVVEE